MITSSVVFISHLLAILVLLAASGSAGVSFSPEQSATPPSVTVAACAASHDPPSCEHALTNSGLLITENASSLHVIHAVLNITFRHLDTAESMVGAILSGSSSNSNLTTAARICAEVLRLSRYRLALTDHGGLRGRKIKDGRAWLSAALGYQYDSWSALKKVNDTATVVNTMALINDTIMGLTRTALSMLGNYDVHGDDVASWGPIKTERDGYWDPVDGSGSDFDFQNGRVPKHLKPNVTVCKTGHGGGCDYATVQAAVYAAPDMNAGQRFVIWIKAGIYKEKVRVSMKKLNVVFLGDGMGKTVITGSLNVGQPGMTTYQTATVGVLGDGFMASNITFENTGVGSQAVAFRSDGDRTVVETCELRGNQDTLYAKSMRQYYKSCRIQGNIDFIFGNSAAFFQDCDILIAPRPSEPEKGGINTITAHGRIDPAQTSGFVFHNCSISGTDDYMKLYRKNSKVQQSYLGRPWKEYSRTVFIGSYLDDIISEEGWYPWDGDFAIKTLYYGEFDNRGAGASTFGRVNWSSIVPTQHVHSYSVRNFIQGDLWT
ncbi:unnamed protein product [Cuscuta epithymum]|uniref:pectinesterase n=1 Tax=Cuscuta epithymum TaxID=186058 RepID=A0AAV0D3W3_9ASTE|nr:unnamed protein product [Cuscuta epithymum]